MAASEAYMDKVQLRQIYRNVWQTDLTNAIQADFPYCCCRCGAAHVCPTCYVKAQHKVEMDKRDGKFGPQYPMAVPPMQQMLRIDQPVPPHVGYPPQPAYYR